MPHRDEHTKDFMRRVMGEDSEGEPNVSLKPLRILKNMTDIASNPKRNLGRFLVRQTTRELMEKDGSLNVLGVYKYMNDNHARGWWDWEPETIWATLEDSHLSDGTPDEIKNMVMALQTVLNTFAPFEHWHIFEKVSQAFNQNHVDFSTLQPAGPQEAAMTMAVLAKIRPGTEYDPEVLIYVATCANVAGMVFLPEELFPGVQKYLDDMTFEHQIRDVTKKVWEGDKAAVRDHAIDIQIGRLQEVRDYVSAEVH